MGHCALRGRDLWNELTGGEDIRGDKVLDVLTEQHYAREPHEFLLQDMVGEDDASDAIWGESKFYDFCPVVFHALRQEAGFTPEEYLASIHGHQDDRDKLTTMVEKFSEGRSSSFFYFTHDKRFMVKTVTDDEQETMIEILKKFCAHMANNPDTLINKIFGCHGIQLQGHKHIKMFLVMESVMWTGNSINYRFDLKGSWVDRSSYKGDKKAKLQEENANGKVENLMKDTDLKEIGFKVYVSLEEKTRLVNQITKDTALFQEYEPYGIMDYSLLLAEHRRSEISTKHDPAVYHEVGYTPLHRRHEGGMKRQRRNADPAALNSIYYVGIIDILQLYDEEKMGENCAKGYLLCKGTHGISSVPPFEYRARYIKAMSDIFQAVDEDGNDIIDSPRIEGLEGHVPAEAEPQQTSVGLENV